MSKLDDIIDYIYFKSQIADDGYNMQLAKSLKEAKPQIKSLMKAVLGPKDVYVDIDYPLKDEEGELLWTKSKIKDSRKQRMARVVTRNELRNETSGIIDQL